MMRTIIRLRTYLAVAVLLLVSGSVSAMPILTFDGPLSFDPGTNILRIDGKVTGSDGLGDPALGDPNHFTLQALLEDTVSYAGVTTGNFITAGAEPDISIMADNDTLLTGDIASLMMVGADTRSSGQLRGTFIPDAGSLLSQFTNPSGLFAFVVSLNTPFGSEMFDTELTGTANGYVIGTENPDFPSPPAAVPEPHLLVLLGTGLLIMTGCRQRCQ